MDTFFDGYRKEFGRIKPSQIQPLEWFVSTLLEDKRVDLATPKALEWRAYILATAGHETNWTWLPVKEAYWLSEAWRKKNLRYYPWFGKLCRA